MSLLKTHRLTAILVIAFLGLSGSTQVYASLPNTTPSIYHHREAVSDEKLRSLAIERKIVPENADRQYFEDELRKKNSVTMWVLMGKDNKVKTIDAVKALFLKNEGAVVSRSADYYVTEINGVVYNSILKGDISPGDSKGIGVMLKTIAIMDGDYNDGSDKLDLSRKQLGSYFERFKTDYPEKYRNLLRAK